MTKSISIILLSLTLIGSTMDLHNLAKMPRLIEHYQEHRNRLSDFSFLDFLNLHYGSQAEQHEQDERGKHRTLPFKMNTCNFSHSLVIVPIINTSEVTSIPAHTINTNLYQSIFYTGSCDSIWQPPRI